MKRIDFVKTVGIGMATAALPFLKAGSPTGISGNLVKPEKLQEGDAIALTAPAGIVYDEAEFVRMQKVLETFGLRVRFGEHVRARHGYFAGTDEQRAEDLNRFFGDPDIKAILALRGGWGCSRILPYLDFGMIRENPKIFCGFSDNTTLHLAFLKHCRLVSFHGPNGTSDWSDLTRQSFRDVLMEGKATSYRSANPVGVIAPGTASGPLIGGNLTILTTSLGTGYQPDLEGAILFMEDIGEPVYKVDRMLTHLREAGMLQQLSGFIFGKCTDCRGSRSRNAGFSMAEIVSQHIKPLGIPAIFGVDISHEPDNFTIPQGLQARLNADRGIFELLEPGVC